MVLKHYRFWGVLALLVLLTACVPNAQTQQSSARHRIIYGLTLEPSGFDPHIHASSELGIPLRQVYDTLIYRDPTTGEFVPGLADSWSISEDGLIYTFNLRQGVKFHDGTNFNAQSVASNLDRIMAPETASQKAIFMLGPYQDHEIVDEYTIRLFLSEPYSPLLDSLSQVYLGMASPIAFSQYSNNRYQFHQVGTGPYIFVEYVPGDHITLRRNSDYTWGPSFYKAETEASLGEIEFRFFIDPSTRALAIESGEAQVMGELSPIDARTLTGNSEVRLLPVGIAGQPLQFLMNTRKYPTDNVQVRQALLYASNRNAIVDTVYQRFSPVAWGPLSSNSLFYNPAVNGAYAHDTAQAEALLTAAGYADSDNNGYLDFNGIELAVTVIVPPWGLIPDVAQLLQDQWRTIGVRAVLESVPTRGALLDAVERGEYNLIAYYSFGVDPSYLNQYFATDASNNWTGYSNADLDNLLNQAVRQSDPLARRDLYAEAQRVIMNEALILPIREYVNLNVARSTLTDITFDAYGWFPLLSNVTVTDGT
jgi:peptide/nickel transport system substrate-binding protein